MPEVPETDESSSKTEQTMIGVNGENGGISSVETSNRENPEKMKQPPIRSLDNRQVGDIPERARKGGVVEPDHDGEEGRIMNPLVNEVVSNENTFAFKSQEKEVNLRKKMTGPEPKVEITIDDCQAKQTLPSAALNENRSEHHKTYDHVNLRKPRSAAAQNGTSSLPRIVLDNSAERIPKTPREMTDAFVSPEHTNCSSEDNVNLSRVCHAGKPNESKRYLEEEEQLQMHQTPSTDRNTDCADRSYESTMSDGSPWVVLRRPGDEKAFLNRCKKTPGNEINGKNEHSGSGMQNGQNEFNGQHNASSSGELNEGFNRTRGQLSWESEQSSRIRDDAAALNPDEQHLQPLSPLIIDSESSNSFLSSTSPSSTKAKRNRSFQAVGRGVAKFFGSKRKYKVDNSEREGSPHSDAEEKTSRSNLELGDKIKDQKKSNGTKRSEVSQQREEKNSSRGFSLFSRGKKREKSVPEA